MTHRAPTDIDARAVVFTGGPTASRARPIVRFRSVNTAERGGGARAARLEPDVREFANDARAFGLRHPQKA